MTRHGQPKVMFGGEISRPSHPQVYLQGNEECATTANPAGPRDQTRDVMELVLSKWQSSVACYTLHPVCYGLLLDRRCRCQTPPLPSTTSSNVCHIFLLPLVPVGSARQDGTVLQTPELCTYDSFDTQSMKMVALIRGSTYILPVTLRA